MGKLNTLEIIKNTQNKINPIYEMRSRDIEKMTKELKKIEQESEKIIPLENIIKETKRVKTLHNLIKNNGQNFNITENEIKLANNLAS